MMVSCHEMMVSWHEMMVSWHEMTILGWMGHGSVCLTILVDHFAAICKAG